MQQALAATASKCLDGVPGASFVLVRRAALVRAGLAARGFVIYAGQGGLSAELFRISTMGNIRAADIDRLLQGFSDLMR